MIERIPQRFHIIILLAACFTLFLPGFFSLPPTDRDESRFAQATKQMVETGDYTDIRFQDVPRYKKPIGIYWLQAASVKIFGHNHSNPIWPYRIPSLLGAMATVIFTYLLGRKLFDDPLIAFGGAALMASCVILNVEARLAKTDAFLTACIVAAQFFYYSLLGNSALHKDNFENVIQQQSHKNIIAFWLAVAIGILIKGPVIVLVCSLTILALCVVYRDIKYFTATRPVLGLLIVALCVAPWLIAIMQKTGLLFFHEAVGHDMLGKVAGGQESHGAPPGFYLLTLLAVFWPGSLLFLRAIPGFRDMARSKNFSLVFLFAWLVPSWLVFELIPTKLVHYTLPLLPSLALLTVYSLFHTGFKDNIWNNLFSRFLGGFLGIILAIALHLLTHSFHSHYSSVLDYVPGALVVIVSLLSVFPLMKEKSRTLIAIYIVSSALLFTSLFQFLLPANANLWPALQIRNIASSMDNRPQSFALLGYNEPSAVFLLGTSTKFLQNAGEALSFLKANPESVVVMDRKYSEEFRNLVKGIPVDYLAIFMGYNYSKGKWMELEMYSLSKSEENP